MISWFRRLSKSAVGITLSVVFAVAILAGFALQDIRSVGSGTFGLSQGPLAKVGARVEGVAPATTAAAMSVLARLLPDGPGRPTLTVEGRVARRRVGSALVERLTVWGNRAAARNNEEPA